MHFIIMKNDFIKKFQLCLKDLKVNIRQIDNKWKINIIVYAVEGVTF